MLARGIYLPPSQFEAWFISLALEDTMIEEAILATAAVLEQEKGG
jgi:glutamate-1-semialdehyde 2,1-aminomutase